MMVLVGSVVSCGPTNRNERNRLTIQRVAGLLKKVALCFFNVIQVEGEKDRTYVEHIERKASSFLCQLDDGQTKSVPDPNFVHHISIKARQVCNNQIRIGELLGDLVRYATWGRDLVRAFDVQS